VPETHVGARLAGDRAEFGSVATQRGVIRRFVQAARRRFRWTSAPPPASGLPRGELRRHQARPCFGPAVCVCDLAEWAAIHAPEVTLQPPGRHQRKGIDVLGDADDGRELGFDTKVIGGDNSAEAKGAAGQNDVLYHWVNAGTADAVDINPLGVVMVAPRWNPERHARAIALMQARDEQHRKNSRPLVLLYRAIDTSGALVDVRLSETRNMAAVRAVFRSAKRSPASRRPGSRRTDTTVTQKRSGPNLATKCGIGPIAASIIGLSWIIVASRAGNNRCLGSRAALGGFVEVMTNCEPSSGPVQTAINMFPPIHKLQSSPGPSRCSASASTRRSSYTCWREP
jgi:hypothetical protein